MIFLVVVPPSDLLRELRIITLYYLDSSFLEEEPIFDQIKMVLVLLVVHQQQNLQVEMC